MKKVVTLVLFMLVLFSVFAESGDCLIIQTKVESVEPVFKLQGTFNKTGEWKDGSLTGTVLNPDQNIDITQPKEENFANEVIAYFRVVQTNDVRSNKGYNITITATDLVNTDQTLTDNNTTTKTDWFYGQKHSVAESALTVAPANIQTSGTGKSYSFTATYSNGQLVAKNTELLQMSFGWTGNANLAAGTYEATIKVEYSAQ